MLNSQKRYSKGSCFKWCDVGCGKKVRYCHTRLGRYKSYYCQKCGKEWKKEEL